MKIDDIYPGIVYAYRQTPQSQPLPLVVLAPLRTSFLYSDRGYHSHGYGDAERHEPYFALAGGQPRRRRNGQAAVGYPAVTLHPTYVFHEARREQAIGTMPFVTLEQFTKAASDQDHERALQFTLLVDPGQVLGPYEEVMAAQRMAEARRQEARMTGEGQLADLADELADLDVTYQVRREDGVPVSVELSLDDMLRLLSRNR